MTEPPASQRAIAITVICWTVILGVVALIAIGHVRKDRPHPVAAVETSDATRPGFELIMTGRAAVAVTQGASTTDALRLQLRTALDGMVTRPVDRLAAATVIRELSGPAAALKLLNPDTTPPRLRPDAAALAALYRADSPAVLSDDQRAHLSHDLGYFGRLAATQGGPADAPARRAVLAEAKRTSVAITVAGVLAAASLLFGIAGLVLLCVLFGTGVLRFAYVPPTTHRPVWLETFAIWMAAFVLFGMAVSFARLHLPMVASELLVAGLTAAVAVGWPMWRARQSLAGVRQTLGWHTGRGVLLEMACGAAGYVAGLPVLAVGLLVTLGLTRLAGAHPSHPIEQEFGDRMTRGHVLALFATAALLAPVLEETMFRGALYAHLRRRHGAWLSAGIVAFLFAAIHPQGWTTIPVLGSIALILAFLREWRGSLIAPMTAHAINNGVLVAVIVLALG